MKQLTAKEIGAINVKGEIVTELYNAWDVFFNLHTRCLTSDDRELRFISDDLQSLVDSIDKVTEDINFKPVNISKYTL